MTIFSAAANKNPAFQSQEIQQDPHRSRKGHIVLVVASSLITGGMAALLLAAAPFIPASGSGVTGAILLGFALGWAVLAALSVRFTDQAQKWALAPALFMGLGGFLLLMFGSPAQALLAWVWPPALLVLAVWMIFRTTRQLRGLGGRLLLYPVMAALVLASLGGGFETFSEVANAGARPTEGQLVDIGGRSLYINCTGSGSPTVVLEPGAGMLSSDLGWIAPTVAQETRVCVYDRAGRGWSEPAKTAQNGAQTAADLHTLLERAHVPGPYVLAGHSFGGLYALAFAARFPADVAGMVLVDSTAPAPEPVSADAARPNAADAIRASAFVSAAAQLGVGRLLDVTASHLESIIDEYIQAGSSAQDAAALREFAGKPLVVLTAGTGSRAGWTNSQDTLAALSTDSLHRVIDGATHASLITDAKDASATSRGILELVAAVRSSRPLVP